MGDLGNIDVDAMGQADIKIDDHVAKMRWVGHTARNGILSNTLLYYTVPQLAH